MCEHCEGRFVVYSFIGGFVLSGTYLSYVTNDIRRGSFRFTLVLFSATNYNPPLCLATGYGRAVYLGMCKYRVKSAQVNNLIRKSEPFNVR